MPPLLRTLSPFQGVLLLLGLLALAIAAYFARALQDFPDPPSPPTPPANPVVAAASLSTAKAPSPASPLDALPLLTDPEESDAVDAPPLPGVDSPPFEPPAAAIQLRREAAQPIDLLHPEAQASLARNGIRPHPPAAAPNTPSWPDSRGKELLAQANRLIGEQRWAEALAAYREVWQERPTQPELVFNLAVCLDHLGQRDEALQAYQQALSLIRGQAATVDGARIKARLAELSPP